MDKALYTRKLESRLLWAWAKACNIWPELDVHPIPTIKLDARVKRAIAYYYCDDNCIRVSSYWAMLDARHVILREIVTHELAHHIDYLLCGEEATEINSGHGPTWQKIMLQLGLKPNTHYTLS